MIIRLVSERGPSQICHVYSERSSPPARDHHRPLSLDATGPRRRSYPDLSAYRGSLVCRVRCRLDATRSPAQPGWESGLYPGRDHQAIRRRAVTVWGIESGERRLHVVEFVAVGKALKVGIKCGCCLSCLSGALHPSLIARPRSSLWVKSGHTNTAGRAAIDRSDRQNRK